MFVKVLKSNREFNKRKVKCWKVQQLLNHWPEWCSKKLLLSLYTRLLNFRLIQMLTYFLLWVAKNEDRIHKFLPFSIFHIIWIIVQYWMILMQHTKYHGSHKRFKNSQEVSFPLHSRHFVCFVSRKYFSILTNCFRVFFLFFATSKEPLVFV